MTELIRQRSEQSEEEYAVEASGINHHLGSDDVAEWGTVVERPIVGSLQVNRKSVLLGILRFSINFCTDSRGIAERKSCHGQGFVTARTDSLIYSCGQPALRTGDVGVCTGIGVKNGLPVMVGCRIRIDRSCQSDEGEQMVSNAPSPYDSHDPEPHRFHLVARWSDGTPLNDAVYRAVGGDQKIEGRLDANGEATFELPTSECIVQFPDYDESLLLHATTND